MECPDVNCVWCGETGATSPVPAVDRNEPLYYHRVCLLRQATGGLKHQRRECHCFGGEDNEPPDEMTRYQEALEIDRLIAEGEWDFHVAADYT